MSDKTGSVDKSKILTAVSRMIDKAVKLYKGAGDSKKVYADSVIMNKDGDILLLQRSFQSDLQPGKWCLPGGKVDPGETAIVAAPRELQEETGLELSVHFIKTVEKENATINYFHGIVSDQYPMLVLDNDEHYRYEFVPVNHLDRYDMIFDLNEVLEDLLEDIPTVMIEDDQVRELTPEEMIPNTPTLVKAAFDNGLIDENDYLVYNQINSALETLKKGYDIGEVTGEEYSNAFEKGKHYEFVNVVRDGKQFYQYREVGTNKIDEELPVGESVDTGDKLGLYIKKYSDKSFLICGDTYKNLELLRKIKNDAGIGSWNRALNGWVFPLSAKESILANLAGKMSIETYEETIDQVAVVELKNSLDVGTTVTVDEKSVEVTEVTTNDAGKVEYTVEPAKVTEKIKSKKEEETELAASLGKKAFHDGKKCVPIYDHELVKLVDTTKMLGGNTHLFEAWSAAWHKENLKPTPEVDPTPEPEIPIGTLSPDGTQIKTADGWEYVKKETKTVKEEDIGVPSADDEKAVELINNVTEENRMKTTKEFFGKKEGDVAVSSEIENDGAEVSKKIEVVEFTTRSGEKINALDFTGIAQKDVQIFDQSGILDKPKPYWIPDIERRSFEGRGYTLNFVKHSEDSIMIELNPKDFMTTYYKTGGIGNTEADYAVVSLEQFVAIQDYYRKVKKAELEKKNLDSLKVSADRLRNWDDKTLEYYKPFEYDTKLSKEQKKKYTKEAWESLSLDAKIAEVPFMKKTPFKGTSTRITLLKDNTYPISYFSMYKKLVDPKDAGILGRRVDPKSNSAIEYNELRRDINYKTNDLEVQREENDSSFVKGRETSYGNSNTKDDLFESHGVLVKRQNGDEINPNEIDQIKENLTKVFESFGDRSSMSKEFGLKISHAGSKNQHAMKAIGVYFPYYKAIGVSDAGKFGFTLAHEYAHFFDNYVGGKNGRHYSSDNFQSTSGQIAKLFRSNMNKVSDSKYINRTCECFARAFEQYHAMKHHGDDVVKFIDTFEKYGDKQTTYVEHENHVSKEKFNTIIKPLIEQFLQENDHILKSAMDELQLIDINNNFELIKAGFDNGLVDEEKFLEYAGKYNDIVKGDPTHGGKLVKKTGTDVKGHKTTKWIRTNEDGESEEVDKVKHTHAALSVFAQDTPASELKRVINESGDAKLRKAAHLELDRRANKEAVKKDKPGEKSVKKKVKLDPKEDTDEIKTTKVTLYHGSDAKFDKFDKDKMGSGEGSDLFGGGFYLTDNKDVADFYAHHTAKKKHIEGYSHDGIFGTPVPKFSKDADEKATKAKQINEFDVEGKILDCSAFKIDDAFRKKLGEISQEHFGDSTSADYSIDYVQKNSDKIKNFRGELPYIIQHVGMGDQAVVKEIISYVKGLGYDGVKYAPDQDFEGNKDSSNYFIFNEKAIKDKKNN